MIGKILEDPDPDPVIKSVEFEWNKKVTSSDGKVWIFWEGHKIWKKIFHIKFDATQ